MAGLLTLTIVTPDGTGAEIRCDSVRLTTPDGIKKNNPGGSFGIRRGHADALLAVTEGPVTAFLEGEQIFAGTVSAGFAMVSGGDTVSVLTDRLTIHTRKE